MRLLWEPQGVLVGLFLVYGFSRLPLAAAGLVGWSSVALLGLAAAQSRVPLPDWTGSLLMFGLANVIGMAWLVERERHVQVVLGQRRDIDILQACAERLADQALQAERSHAHFLGDASHDLRLPLQSTSLALDSLEQTPLSVRQVDLVHRIRGAIHRTDAMLRDLFESSRLQEGVFVPRPDRVRLDLLLAAIVDESRSVAEQRGLALTATLQEVAVRADPLLVERLMRNLLALALDQAGGGGLAIECTAARGGARVTVVDRRLQAGGDAWRWITDVPELSAPLADVASGGPLELAIARTIAQMSGARLCHVASGGDGIALRVTFPPPVGTVGGHDHREGGVGGTPAASEPTRPGATQPASSQAD